MPISLLEAMALGKICLVTDCIGNRDLIKNEINGFIISEDNYKDLIIQLSSYNIKNIKENALNDVLKEYNLQKMVNDYKNIY